jgi:hypothetical protein
MTPLQVYEGTADEIADQLRADKLTGRLRAIVMPEVESKSGGNEDNGATLLERLQGRVGRFDFGEVHLSEDTGRKFAALLDEKYRKGQG